MGSFTKTKHRLKFIAPLFIFEGLSVLQFCALLEMQNQLWQLLGFLVDITGAAELIRGVCPCVSPAKPLEDQCISGLCASLFQCCCEKPVRSDCRLDCVSSESGEQQIGMHFNNIAMKDPDAIVLGVLHTV